MPRPASLIAPDTSTRAVCAAGARPKTTPVRTDVTIVNASAAGSSAIAAAAGVLAPCRAGARRVAAGERRQQRHGPEGEQQPDGAAGQGEDDAFGEQLPGDPQPR